MWHKWNNLSLWQYPLQLSIMKVDSLICRNICNYSIILFVFPLYQACPTHGLQAACGPVQLTMLPRLYPVPSCWWLFPASFDPRGITITQHQLNISAALTLSELKPGHEMQHSANWSYGNNFVHFDTLAKFSPANS